MSATRSPTRRRANLALGLALAATLATSLAAQPTLGVTATLHVPSALSFFVLDLRVATSSSPSQVTVGFSDATVAFDESIRISVAADDSTFTPPGGGAAIPASGLSWTTHSPSSGLGWPGTLSSGSFQTVFESSPGATAASVDLAWTLAPLPAGVAAGDHGLTVRYRFEALD